MRVFDYNDYRTYLFEVLGGKKRTGAKQRLSEHLNCQPAHLSQILKEKNNLSLEHAFKANSFLGHSKHEADYFLNLVHIGNAGTKDLIDYYIEKNEIILKAASDVRGSLKSKSKALSKEDQAIYYSNRLYALIHVSVSLPHINTIDDLEGLLKTGRDELNEIIQFLLETNIIAVDQDGNYTTGSGHTFLDKSSPFLKTHHQNLRRHASLKVERNLKSNDLHYATYFTLSKKDFEKLKQNFLDLISDNLKLVEPSEEETLCCNIIDFFEVK